MTGYDPARIAKWDTNIAAVSIGLVRARFEASRPGCYRGDFLPVDMDRFNDELSGRRPSGIWASDHAGLVATLVINPLPSVVRRFTNQAIFATSTNLSFDRPDVKLQHGTETMLDSSSSRTQCLSKPTVDHTPIAKAKDGERDDELRVIVFQHPRIDELLT